MLFFHFEDTEGFEDIFNLDEIDIRMMKIIVMTLFDFKIIASDFSFIIEKFKYLFYFRTVGSIIYECIQ